MKQKLLYFILSMLLSATFATAQDHVWDFGNDDANWVVSTTTADNPDTIDGLTLVPGGAGKTVGTIDANNTKWYNIPGDNTSGIEYESVQRLKLDGSGGIDPSGGVDFTPTQRYITFPVDGPISIKLYFRPSGTGARTLWITDGSAEVTSWVSPLNTDPAYLEVNYNGAAGDLYLFGASNSFNLYKLEISSTLLGADDFKSPVTTNLKSFGNRIYVSNVTTKTEVNIYSITGALVKSFQTTTDIDFSFKTGLWIATAKTDEGQKAVKLVTQ